MNWSELAPIIAKAAPLLGSALGPIGTIAGGAVGAIISSVTGTPADDPAAAAAAIAADPALLEKLREAEMANQALLASYALQQHQAELAAQTAADAQRTAQYQAEASDRDSARKLAAQQPKDWMRPLLSIAIIAATIAIVFIVLLGVADGTLRDPVIAATAGGLVMYFLKESSQVTGFWFGMTQQAAVTNAKVADFATSPGSVSTPSSTPQAVTVSTPTTPPSTITVAPEATYRGH